MQTPGSRTRTAPRHTANHAATIANTHNRQLPLLKSLFQEHASMSAQQQEAIVRIKKIQENIAVVVGVIIALTLSVYFFTYAMLVDKGLEGMIWAQGLSAIAMLLILIYLKQVSFFLARLWLGRKAEYKDALASLAASDSSHS